MPPVDPDSGGEGPDPAWFRSELDACRTRIARLEQELRIICDSRFLPPDYQQAALDLLRPPLPAPRPLIEVLAETETPADDPQTVPEPAGPGTFHPIQ